MVSSSRPFVLAFVGACLAGIGIFAVAQVPKSDAQLDFRVARARATLIAYLCSCYETDNGRFPVSEAELHWPVDYVGKCSELYGFDFEKANKDPLSNRNKFLIKPVLRERIEGTSGVKFRGADVDWWIIYSSGGGIGLYDYDLIYLEKLNLPKGFLESAGPDSPNDILFISDKQIRDLVTSPEFELKEVIKAAELQ